jgi:hypothetical protein
MVAGDFNAKAFMWGSAVEDAKGRMLADWAAAMNHEPRRAHVREGRKQVGPRRYILFARHRQAHTGMARDGSRDDYQRPPAHRIHDQGFPQFTGGRTSSAWMEMDRQQKGRAGRAVDERTRTS